MRLIPTLLAKGLVDIMRDDCPISHNLKIKQEAFFSASDERGFSRAWYAAKTKIPVATLATYVAVPSRPAAAMPLAAFIKLAKVAPRDLANLLIEDSGLSLCDIDRDETNWAALAGSAAGLASDVCVALSDGKVDHREKLTLQERTRRLIAEAQGAVA